MRLRAGMIVAAASIEDMIAKLSYRANNHIEFEPGKPGRNNRFTLVAMPPHCPNEARVVAEVQMSGVETVRALKILDEEVRTDPDLVMFGKPLEGPPMWGKLPSGRKSQTEIEAVTPLFERRLEEQRLLSSGALQAGRVVFGIGPHEGGG